MVATTGLWMQRIAQDWLVLELTGSVTAVGVAVALQFLPMLMFGLFGGVVADRFPKRTILIITQSTLALVATTLGVLALTGAVQPWHVYVLAFVLGLVTVVDNPTRQVFVSELVGQAHIRNAVSLNSSVFQLGALVGPAFSGALIHAVGQGWSFLINAASCLVVVIMVAVIRARPAPGTAGPPAAAASCARRCATSVAPPRWPGPSCWPPPSGCSGSTCRSSWRRSPTTSSPPAYAATACSARSPPWARWPVPSCRPAAGPCRASGR